MHLFHPTLIPFRLRTVAQLQAYVQTPAWEEQIVHDPDIRTKIETLIADAKDRE